MVKIVFLASLIAISAVQSSAQTANIFVAQTADIFVKGDSNQCWLDVKDIVHRRSTLVTEDEKQRLLQAEHFSSMFGDLVLGVQVQVIPDKNKKGQGGCRISVTVQWDGSRIGAFQQSNPRHHKMSMAQSDNLCIASLIASEVEGMKKTRDKKTSTLRGQKQKSDSPSKNRAERKRSSLCKDARGAESAFRPE